jgi:membrane dipeptidase
MNVNRREFMNATMAAALATGASGQDVSSNDSIRQPREAALAILQPSEKELRHGLELHAASIVMEPYGFAPRAAVDGDAVARAMVAGASDAEIEDLMDEMENTRFVTDAGERREFVQAWKASGMTCVFQNAGQESQDPLRLMRRLACFTYALDMMDDFLIRVTAPEDILEAKKQQKGALALSMNGVPLMQQWNSREDELRLIRVFFRLGVRMMHLTYNRRNMIGDGCGEATNASLSDFGRAVIDEMNRVGVIVDVSHSGWQTSLEAAKASKLPVVASHSGCAALNNHFRCKPDEVIRAIADTGGLLGICAVPQFLGRSGDLNAMLDHIDYVARKFGVDHVAIATDYSYRSRAAGVEHQKIPKRRRLRAQWEALWPIPLRADPQSQRTMAWTNWPLFTVGLVKRGYSDSDIQKIIGGNALRVVKTAFPAKMAPSGA